MRKEAIGDADRFARQPVSIRTPTRAARSVSSWSVADIGSRFKTVIVPDFLSGHISIDPCLGRVSFLLACRSRVCVHGRCLNKRARAERRQLDGHLTLRAELAALGGRCAPFHPSPFPWQRRRRAAEAAA